MDTSVPNKMPVQLICSRIALFLSVQSAKPAKDSHILRASSVAESLEAKLPRLSMRAADGSWRSESSPVYHHRLKGNGKARGGGTKEGGGRKKSQRGVCVRRITQRFDVKPRAVIIKVAHITVRSHAKSFPALIKLVLTCACPRTAIPRAAIVAPVCRTTYSVRISPTISMYLLRRDGQWASALEVQSPPDRLLDITSLCDDAVKMRMAGRVRALSM